MSVHFIPYRKDKLKTVLKKIRTVGNPAGGEFEDDSLLGYSAV
jgi:hypothetical protein